MQPQGLLFVLTNTGIVEGIATYSYCLTRNPFNSNVNYKPAVNLSFNRSSCMLEEDGFVNTTNRSH